MRLSIVTISLNQAPFIKRALRSVLDQDDVDVEYIVVDAGSTDGSREILERYRSRLAALILEPDDGPADGLNKGVGSATGDVLGYLNADDAYLPGALARAAAAFVADPSADVVYAHGYLVDSAGRLVRRLRSTTFDARRYVRGAVTVVQQATFIRRTAFEAVGGFNAANRTSWDGELLVDLALAGRRLKLVDEYWGVFTIHSRSITGTGTNGAAYHADCRRLFERVMGRSPGDVDRALAVAARIGKHARDPAGLALRAVDAMRTASRRPPLAGGVR